MNIAHQLERHYQYGGNERCVHYDHVDHMVLLSVLKRRMLSLDVVGSMVGCEGLVNRFTINLPQQIPVARYPGAEHPRIT